MQIRIETGKFNTYSWIEGENEYLRYTFDRSNNVISFENSVIEILQLPIAIANEFPSVNVRVLNSVHYEHQVTNNTLYSISDVKRFRDKDFVYITINPFLNNDQVASEIEVNIDLKENMGQGSSDRSNNMFINKSYADGLQKPINLLNQSFKKSSNFTGNWLDVKVSEEGIYSISRSELTAMGLNAEFDDDNVYLYAGPGFGGELRNYFPDSSDFHLKQVPLLFFDAVNDDEDKWVFYGSENSSWERETATTDIRYVNFNRNPYESEQHYRLFIGTSNEEALRMEQVSNTLTGSEVQQDYYYKRLHFEEESINPGKGGELWFGQRLKTSNTFNFYLNNLYTDLPLEGAIRFSYGLVSEGSHSFTTYVEDSLVSSLSATLSGNSDDKDTGSSIIRQKQLSLSNTILSEELDVTVAYQGGYSTSEAYLDYIDIIYPASPNAIDGQLKLWFRQDEDARKVHVTGLSGALSYVFSVENPFETHYTVVSGVASDIRIPASDKSSAFLLLSEGDFKSPASLLLLSDYEPSLADEHNDQVDLIIITPEAFLSEANRLATFKESRSIDPLATSVKTYKEIVGQFNAGNRDPYAIQHYLANIFAMSPAPKPLYVLLLGDGHFDYQNKIYSQANYIPFLYEPNTLWPCDDIYVMVNSIDDPINDMAIGRIPANSIEDAKAVIDKIIEYDSRENPGEWQLNTMLVADDPTDLAQGYPFINQTAFILDSERLYRNLIPKVMQTKKVYLTEYPERYITELQTEGRDGAREDIMEAFLNGVSFVNYYGHGDPSVWTQEKVFVRNDLTRLNVEKQYPFILAATCSWGRSDNPDMQSMAEEIVNLEANGAIASLATVRSVYHGGEFSYNVKFVEDFMRGLFVALPDFAYAPLIGDALLYAKNESNSGVGASSRLGNNMKFMYFGDPSIIPAFPLYGGEIDSLSRDTLRALDQVNISGKALDRDGDELFSSDLNGKITIYDNKYTVTREFVSNLYGRISTVSYELQGNRLFNGNVTFDGKDFSTIAFIPKDIQYYGTSGKVRMIYWDDEGTVDGAFVKDGVYVGGINPNALADVTGPQITLRSSSSELTNGAVIYDTSRVEIIFEDESGINITGSTGHVLQMSVDNGLQIIDLSELFSYEENGFTRGGVSFPVSNYLDQGEHLIEIVAFDNYNNYSQTEITMNIINVGDDIVQNLVNFPNPFKGETDITFSSVFNGSADLRVYTISGKPVINIKDIAVESGFNAIHIQAQDDHGYTLAAGVYFYVLEISNGMETIKQHNKMVVLP